MKGVKKKVTDIPDYPGPLPKKAPEPPKYLVQQGEGGSHQLVQVKGTPPEVRPQGVGDPNVPILAKEATVVPKRDYESPAHYYEPRKEYTLPGSTASSKSNSSRKDSRRDVKKSFTAQDGRVVQYSAPPTALPKLPAIPRPFVPTSARAFQDGPMLHARSADGKILGGPTRRMVPSDHVPHLASAETGRGAPSSRAPSSRAPSSRVPSSASGTSRGDFLLGSSSSPLALMASSGGGVMVRQSSQQIASEVGPDNPVQELNDVWSACWDDEAGATYYYNRESGEATWIIPDGITT